MPDEPVALEVDDAGHDPARTIGRMAEPVVGVSQATDDISSRHLNVIVHHQADEGAERNSSSHVISNAIRGGLGGLR